MSGNSTRGGLSGRTVLYNTLVEKVSLTSEAGLREVCQQYPKEYLNPKIGIMLQSNDM